MTNEDAKTAYLSFDIVGKPRTKIDVDKFLQSQNFDDVPITDYIPKEEDFIYVTSRMLSATIVGSGTWKSTDFSNQQILKTSLDKLEGQPAYTDHNLYSVDNAIGTIVNVYWQEAYTNDKGEFVPAGANGEFKIDAKLNPKIARQVLNGSVQSCSVGISFTWKPSQTFDSKWDFQEKIGTIVNGAEVTRIVTGIDRFYECSLVSVPADKYAKILKNTEVGKKASTSMSDNITEEEFESQIYSQYHTYAVFSGVQSQAPTTPTNTESNTPAETTPQKQSQATFDASEFASVISALNEKLVFLEQEIQKKESELESVKLKLSKSNETIQGLEQTIKQNEVFVLEGQSVLNYKREQAIRLYNLQSNTNPTMREQIQNASGKVLDAFIEMFGGNVSSMFGATCEKCGDSKHISYQSSIKPESTKKPIIDVASDVRAYQER